jgi:hypothetical protein
MSSYKPLSWSDQVGQRFIGLIVVDDGADWKAYDDIFSGSSRAIGSATLATDFCFVVFLVPEVEERGHARRRFKHNTAAVAAIATVRSAARHEFFASKTACAVAAAAGFDMDTDFIDKHLAPFQRDDCLGMTCEEHPVAPLLMPGVLAVTKL